MSLILLFISSCGIAFRSLSKNMQNHNPQVYLLAPIPAINRRTRIKKQVDILLRHGFQVTLLGWERVRGETELSRHTDECVTEKMILRGGGYASRTTHMFYIFWIIRVFFAVLFLPRRSKIICLGFESAFPAILASVFTRSVVIFDDADRFSMILSLPHWPNAVLQALERWTSRRVLLHLIPGKTRYDWHGENMVVLRNTPNLADFDAAVVANKDDGKSGFTLYANGWIGETRGAPIFLALMERLAKSSPEVMLKLIGRGDGDAYDKLRKLPNVDTRLEVPQIQALSAYCRADLVLTFYDPKVPINRQAESNKWGDCVFLNVPFVVNSEVETAAAYRTANACFAVPYADVTALHTLVLDLLNNSQKLDEAKQQLQQFRPEFLPFDVAFTKILQLSGILPIEQAS